MPATIKQVAQLAGVSTSTVSHVINSTHYVSPELTKRVMHAVKELNYELNPVARMLAGGRSRLIGVIIPDLFNSYTGEIIRGIDSELSAEHYDVVIYTLRNDRVKNPFYAQSLMGLVAGLLLIVPLGGEEYVEQLLGTDLPYVMIDHHGFGVECPIIESKNWKGSFEAAEHLIGIGHQRIGYIMGDTHLQCTYDRLDGYKAALAKHGIPFDPQLVVAGDFAAMFTSENILTLLSLNDRPTAIMAGNDVIALRAIDVLRQMGLQTPEDMSVVGFDDIPQAAATHPALTTVHQSLFEMGRTGARVLLDRVDDVQRPLVHVQLDTQLIIRETTKTPK